MSTGEILATRVRELAERSWDMPAIEKRFNQLVRNGISPKKFTREELESDRQQIQERVRQRAEEYNFFLHNCAQGTALALLEEFGLGNMDIIKALMPFPGIGGTGEMCGGVTGALVAFGLFFSGENILDLEATGKAMFNAQKYMVDFIDQLGYLTCAEIQEKVIFGRNMDPGQSEENMEAFAKEKGFERCGLAPGIGASLAAGYIIDNMS